MKNRRAKCQGDRLIIAKGCSPPFKGGVGTDREREKEKERRITLLRLAAFFNCRDVFPEKRALQPLSQFSRITPLALIGDFPQSWPCFSPPPSPLSPDLGPAPFPSVSYSRISPVNSFLLFRFSLFGCPAPFTDEKSSRFDYYSSAIRLPFGFGVKGVEEDWTLKIIVQACIEYGHYVSILFQIFQGIINTFKRILFQASWELFLPTYFQM